MGHRRPIGRASVLDFCDGAIALDHCVNDGDQPALHRIFEGAGFREISFTPVDLVMELAGSGGAAEAAEFAMLFGPLTRILPALPPEQHEAVRSAREVLSESRHAARGRIAGSVLECRRGRSRRWLT